MDNSRWPRVYLAGPILGCTEEQGSGWRKLTDAMLHNCNLVGVSPLRCEDIEPGKKRHGFGDSTDIKFGTGTGIAAKNMFDVLRCDATLAYLPKPSPFELEKMVEDGHEWTQSYGTLIELGWARMANKLVVIVSDDPKIIKHPVVKSCAGWPVLPTIKDAVDVLDAMFGAYNGGKNV